MKPALAELNHVARPAARLADEVLAGLRAPHKRLPTKLFYDAVGSQLFEQICELPEYYLTRTELAIMHRYAANMAAMIGPRALLVELGSGSSLKTRALLDHLDQPAAYVPIDISPSMLAESSATLAAAYHGLQILPVCADYTDDLSMPDLDEPANRTVVYFPGSTIGNFHPRQACKFLRRMRRLVGNGGGMLVGIDLKKNPAVLHAAYNDAQGITAAFNLNMLDRVNRELAGNFVVEQFSHYAFYNPRRGRIEMHLVSREDQKVRVAGETFHFRRGESMLTECSYKYTLDEFEELALEAGFGVDRIWLDEDRRFGVQFLEADV